MVYSVLLTMAHGTWFSDGDVAIFLFILVPLGLTVLLSPLFGLSTLLTRRTRTRVSLLLGTINLLEGLWIAGWALVEMGRSQPISTAQYVWLGIGLGLLALGGALWRKPAAPPVPAPEPPVH